MEIWKDIEGYNGKYQVSNFGNVRRTAGKGSPNGRVLKLSKNKYHPYDLFAQIGSPINKPRVRALVAKAFIDKPEGNFKVCKINNIAENNRADNLFWKSVSDIVKESHKSNPETWGRPLGSSYKGCVAEDKCGTLYEFNTHREAAEFFDMPLVTVQSSVRHQRFTRRGLKFRNKR